MYAWLPTIKENHKVGAFQLEIRTLEYAFLILQSRSNVSHMFDYPQSKHQARRERGNLRQIKRMLSTSFLLSPDKNCPLKFCTILSCFYSVGGKRVRQGVIRLASAAKERRLSSP